MERQSLMWILFIIIAIVAIGALVAMMADRDDSVINGNNDINGELPLPNDNDVQEVSMSAANFSFDPATTTVEVNRPVAMTIESDGQHTFDIPELGISEVLQDGTNTFTFTPTQTGEFTFFCDIPGHREQGMEGILIVE